MEELKKLFGDESKKGSDEDWMSILNEFDKNKDGVIEFSEFKSAMENWAINAEIVNKSLSKKII